MKHISWMTMMGGLVVLVGAIALAQPPDDRDPYRGRDDGPPPGRRQGPPPPGRPMPWEPGKIIPPPVQDELRLTDDQQKQLAELEKEVKDRILKILTEDQKKKLKDFRFGPPPPRDHRDGPPPPRRGRPGPPEDRRDDRDDPDR